MIREQDVEASRQVDLATQALVPTCPPGALPTDAKHLETMFVFCTNNWRTYCGEKPTGDKLVSLPTKRRNHLPYNVNMCSEISEQLHGLHAGRVRPGLFRLVVLSKQP